ncbi:hypothetical protein QFZ35_000501 [Arthrobacter ulcerisalmonis]|uniref:hypothetical protein n=1 Tax=Arthrobacter sp. B1I2 TaxID=3042263 RepID=UPI00278310EC|nr:MULTISPECIES: hypothetical protein [Arthrobacter]MDQ0662003.1 hypothetical protein [Arthrobacter ulcerisalmonis]MDQ0729924.1 hypothetical protein [Arthrobacter sp. B1I2]
MHKPGLLLALTTTALISACGSPVGACPAIAQATAVSVTVTVGYSPQVGALHVRACQDGTCKEADVELRPGSTSVDSGCSPEGSCSATASPDGTKVAVLMLQSLTESPMTATVSGTAPDGTALPVRTLEFQPQAAYPFGEQCGKVLSASVSLDDAGLHQLARP